jgi:hypothetical protein
MPTRAFSCSPRHRNGFARPSNSNIRELLDIRVALRFKRCLPRGKPYQSLRTQLRKHDLPGVLPWLLC